MSATFNDFSKPDQQQSFFRRNKIAIIIAILVLIAIIIGVVLFFVLRPKTNADFGVEFMTFAYSTGFAAKLTNNTAKPIKVDWAVATVHYKNHLVDDPSIKTDFEAQPKKTVSVDTESTIESNSKKLSDEVEKHINETVAKSKFLSNNPKIKDELTSGKKVKLDRKIVVKYSGKEFTFEDQFEQVVEADKN